MEDDNQNNDSAIVWTLRVGFTEAQKTAFKRFADSNGLTYTNLVRVALWEYLTHFPMDMPRAGRVPQNSDVMEDNNDDG